MRNRIIQFVATVAAAAALGLASPAWAKSKNTHLSYEEAWAVCKKFVDDGVKSWDQHTQRYARGAACMKKYGYRI